MPPGPGDAGTGAADRAVTGPVPPATRCWRRPSGCSPRQNGCAPNRPLVLVTEDLQWADEASLLVWQRLARAVGQLPLLLAGTYRPEPEREQVTRLRGEVLARGGTVLSLQPLPAGHLPELVRT